MEYINEPQHTQTLAKPSNVISLATSSMLVRVEVNVWSATKQDREISNEVTHAKKADASAGRFVKNLLANDPYHKNVSNYRQTIYNWLQRTTYDWNKAQGILPSVDIERFMAEYKQHEDNFNALLEDFLTRYESIKSDMAFKQGDMFNVEDYPSVEEVRSKFGVRLYVSEVPKQDFRCAIAQDIADDLHSQYQEQLNGIIQNVARQQAERLSEVLTSISYCCGYDEVEKNGEIKTKKRKIYDSTIEKAKELAKQIQEFNVMGDERLTDAAYKLEEALTGMSAERIRDSEAARARVKDEVEDIMGKFGF
jgi:hypothetical protein